jgi:NAD(P)H-flavin reductase
MSLDRDENVYKPHIATITDIRDEAAGGRPIKTFRTVFDDPQIRDSWTQRSGQCVMLNVLGVGESFVSICSPPSLKGALEFSVMRVGNVTSALHEMRVGDKVAIRGPYGNGFPLEKFKGRDLLFVGAGIGIAPLRSVYMEVLEPRNRKDYGNVVIIYGARTPADLAYKAEFDALLKRNDVEVYQCIDWKFGLQGPIEEDAAPGWIKINLKDPAATVCKMDQHCYTAFVPQMLEALKPEPKDLFALTCGPPVAIKFVVQNLTKLGFSPTQIFTTLENRMKCGIGKCGRCNIGHVYVCKDGPVFSYDQINKMPPEY